MQGTHDSGLQCVCGVPAPSPVALLPSWWLNSAWKRQCLLWENVTKIFWMPLSLTKGGTCYKWSLVVSVMSIQTVKSVRGKDSLQEAFGLDPDSLAHWWTHVGGFSHIIIPPQRFIMNIFKNTPLFRHFAVNTVSSSLASVTVLALSPRYPFLHVCKWQTSAHFYYFSTNIVIFKEAHRE